MTKKKDKKPKEQIAYLIEIVSFEVNYSFSISWSEKLFPGPYWEYAGVDIKGTILKPESYKYREIVGTILGSRDLTKAVDAPEECRNEPHGVGHINLRGKESEFLVSIPFDVFQLIYEIWKDGNIKFLNLSGFPLYRGHSWIRSITFDKDNSEKDENPEI